MCYLIHATHVYSTAVNVFDASTTRLRLPAFALPCIPFAAGVHFHFNGPLSNNVCKNKGFSDLWHYSIYLCVRYASWINEYIHPFGWRALATSFSFIISIVLFCILLIVLCYRLLVFLFSTCIFEYKMHRLEFNRSIYTPIFLRLVRSVIVEFHSGMNSLFILWMMLSIFHLLFFFLADYMSNFTEVNYWQLILMIRLSVNE